MPSPRRLLIILACPAIAWAGMPSVSLTDLARFRLDAVSFCLLLLALAVPLLRWLWNGLVRDLAWLPRLSWRGALGALVCFGAAIWLVLSMINGARELMTPGAWERDGAIYVPSAVLAAREARLRRLQTRLWPLAVEGRLPTGRSGTGLTPQDWQAHNGDELHYWGGQLLGSPRPVAWEPETVHGLRWVLFADGRVERLDRAAIADLLRSQP